jgi:RNA methyltransferase, RsmD family
MRIISGKYKGKKLDGFNIEGTRPTMDRVKESLFGIIQNYIKGSIVLDLFAGTGSLGIEALSNGSSKCYFVDNGKDIKKSLLNNIKEIDDCIYLDLDYQKAIDKFSVEKIKFDIIFLDPPYHKHIINNAISQIVEKHILANNGIIVCEYEDELIEKLDDFLIIKEKKYGDKNIIILKSVN